MTRKRIYHTLRERWERDERVRKEPESSEVSQPEAVLSVAEILIDISDALERIANSLEGMELVELEEESVL